MSRGEWIQIAGSIVSALLLAYLIILLSDALPAPAAVAPAPAPAAVAPTVAVAPKPVRTPEPPLAAHVSALRAELIAEGVLSPPPKIVRPRVPTGPFDPAACPEFHFVKGKDSPSIFPDGHWTPVLDMWVTGVSESHECWMRRCRAMGKDDEWCN